MADFSDHFKTLLHVAITMFSDDVCLSVFQVPLTEQDEPEVEVNSSLIELSAKELAYHLTIYENQLFRSVSAVSFWT